MIHVEFYGVARLRAGCPSVDLGDCTTLGDLLSKLAERFPDLADECLLAGEAGYQLRPAYTINLNDRFVRDASHPLAAGDEVLLLATDAGG